MDKELEEVQRLFLEDNPAPTAEKTEETATPAASTEEPAKEATTTETAAIINEQTPQSNTEKEETGSEPKTEEPVSQVIETPSASTEEPSESETKPEVSPTVDLSKLLDETSGGKIKSTEDLKKFLSDFENAQQQLTDPNVEYAKKLSAWEKGGHPKEMFDHVQSTDFTELDDSDMVKFKIKLDNPEWTREQIELFVEKKYSLDEDSNDEKTVQYGKLLLKQDADAYFKDLESLKEMTHVENDPARAQKEQENLEESRKQSWNQSLNSLISEFTEVPVQVDSKGDKYTWKVTPEERSEMADIMKNIVNNAPLQYDENGKAIFNEILRKEFINKNFNKIAQGISNHISSKKTEEKIAEIHNPTGAKTPPQPAAIEKKSADDQIMEAIMKAEGL